MKFKDFRTFDYVKNSRNDSKYYNMKNLSYNYKIAIYFMNYFSNPKSISLIMECDPYAFKNNLPPAIYERINVMTDYIINEQTPQYGCDKIDISCDQDNNLIKTTIAVKLALVFTSSLSKKQPVNFLDEYFKKLFYNILNYYDTFDIVDDIIYNKGVVVEPYVKTHNKQDVEKKSLDYDFNKDKEYAIITSILNTNIDFINSFSNIKNSISEYYASMIGSYDFMMGRDIEFENRYSIYNAIRDIRTELLCKDLNDKVKENLLSKLDQLISDKDFDDINEYRNLSSTLMYGGQRPIDESDKLMERYGDISKYKYKGIVYHGFHNTNGTVDVLGALRYYENGYISCSKDINIAKNFSHTYDSGLFGGIIEIYVDENVEAIDIEKILEDEFNKSKNRYKNLYNNFISEKEVLIKMPIKKYKYISPSEFDRYYANNKKYSTYKPKGTPVEPVIDEKDE